MLFITSSSTRVHSAFISIAFIDSRYVLKYSWIGHCIPFQQADGHNSLDYVQNIYVHLSLYKRSFNMALKLKGSISTILLC